MTTNILKVVKPKYYRHWNQRKWKFLSGTYVLYIEDWLFETRNDYHFIYRSIVRRKALHNFIFFILKSRTKWSWLEVQLHLLAVYCSWVTWILEEKNRQFQHRHITMDVWKASGTKWQVIHRKRTLEKNMHVICIINRHILLWECAEAVLCSTSQQIKHSSWI